MKSQIIIEVDTNDADYNTQVSEIDEGDLLVVRKIAELIKEFKPYKSEYKSSSSGEVRTWNHSHNWPEGDILRDDLGEKDSMELYGLTEEEHDIFSNYLPWCEYGFHTIESIKIFPLVESEELLKKD